MALKWVLQQLLDHRKIQENGKSTRSPILHIIQMIYLARICPNKFAPDASNIPKPRQHVPNQNNLKFGLNVTVRINRNRCNQGCERDFNKHRKNFIKAHYVELIITSLRKFLFRYYFQYIIRPPFSGFIKSILKQTVLLN